ncbi:hypothetical protein FGB62_28g223 [Gracilaria domingensis]|nr:hypothetical protein FGB62_28g223 [Gracilaria domingensis]
MSAPADAPEPPPAAAPPAHPPQPAPPPPPPPPPEARALRGADGAEGAAAAADGAAAAAAPAPEACSSPSAHQPERPSHLSPPAAGQHALVHHQQQPLLQPSYTHKPAPSQPVPVPVPVFVDPQPAAPQAVHAGKPPRIDHDDKENIPPVWMQYALQSKPEEKGNKPFKSSKLAVPLSEAGVQKKRDQSRSPLRDITSAVVGNRRPNLFTLRRSPRKKHLTLRYLR